MFKPILQMRIVKVSSIKSLGKRWSWGLRDARARCISSKTLLCYPLFPPNTPLAPFSSGKTPGLERTQKSEV